MLFVNEAVLAAVPAEAAAEPVAGDRDVRRRAVQDGEAQLGRARDDLLPLDARADAGAEGDGVELDGVEPVGLEQDDVLERARTGSALWPVRCGATRRPLAAA